MTSLRQAGVSRGNLVGLVVSPALGLGLATADRAWPVAAGGDELGRADEALRPRWVVWSGHTAVRLAIDGVRLATCWDIAAAHQAAVRRIGGPILAGRGPGCAAWTPARCPADGPFDLFGMDEGDATDPVAPDGHLRSEWVSGGWSDSLERMARWAELARMVARLQRDALAALPDRPMALATGHCESTAELLCAELSVDGLPMDGRSRRKCWRGSSGPGRTARPRPRGCGPLATRRCCGMPHPVSPPTCAARPRCVRCSAGSGWTCPTPGRGGCVKLRDAHPLVGALLEWRKAERIATTYGYAWLDEHLGADGRLRGAWTGSDARRGGSRVGGPA